MCLFPFSTHNKIKQLCFGGYCTFQYGKNIIGKGCRVYDPFTLGFPSRERMMQTEFTGATIGDGAVLRSGGTIYCDVSIGHDFQCGHNILIRERTVIGNNVVIGTASIIEGSCSIGNNVRIQSMVFIPTHTDIGNGVFIGPCAVLTNDRYPPTGKPELKGPVIEENAVIGANSTILPGIRIGKGALVAAGAVVTRDVPDGKMAIGVPAVIQDLPEEMRGSDA
ncbi:MAG TPA: acyltransferase [Methanoregulaceae archaeon]|nr:acyltransferase [Methanoregulaceae archaeon]